MLKDIQIIFNYTAWASTSPTYPPPWESDRTTPVPLDLQAVWRAAVYDIYARLDPSWTFLWFHPLNKSF